MPNTTPVSILSNIPSQKHPEEWSTQHPSTWASQVISSHCAQIVPIFSVTSSWGQEFPVQMSGMVYIHPGTCVLVNQAVLCVEHVCGSQKSTTGIYLSGSLPYFFRQDLWLNLELTLWICCLIGKLWVYTSTPRNFSFYVGLGSEPRSSCLHSKHFTHCANSPTLWVVFY